jgi:hypothetical protein
VAAALVKMASLSPERKLLPGLICPMCGLLPSPGRLAFHHRHAALGYVRRNAPDLHSEAMRHGYDVTQRDGLTFDDYVARLEAENEQLRRKLEG